MKIRLIILIFLVVRCGVTDEPAMGGKVSNVEQVKDTAIMKSRATEVNNATPEQTLNREKVGSTGDSSNPAVVKNAAAKHVTPVVKKETPVWDWPVKAKFDIPKCRKLYFHNENLVSDIHRGKNTAMVYRYRDGKLEFKKDIDNKFRNFIPLKDGKSIIWGKKTEWDREIVYKIYLTLYDENFTKEIKGNKLGRIIDYLDHCQFFIYDSRNIFIQWNSGHKKYDIENKERRQRWNIVTFNVETGKMINNKPASLFFKGVHNDFEDRIKENMDNCLTDVWTLYNERWLKDFSTTIYADNNKIISSKIGVFDKTMDIKKMQDECFIQEVLITLHGKKEQTEIRLYDNEVKDLLKPSCKRAKRFWLTNYHVHKRPGGGVIITFSYGYYKTVVGSYYREYSSEGKPIGPVIKTQSEVEILSENHYRVTEGCHYEYRHRPVTK